MESDRHRLLVGHVHDVQHMTLEEAINELQKRVYEATLIIEHLEAANKLNDVGHKLRQNIAFIAGTELKGAWKT